MSIDAPTDAERYPTLTDEGRKMLQFLREHPHAPIYRNESGNRLTRDDIERLRQFERETLAAEVGWRPGERPAWLDDFTERCFAEVPFYRRYGSRPKDFADIPTISRAELSRDLEDRTSTSAPSDRRLAGT